MPLFYFLPFKFKSDVERAKETRIIDFGPARDMILYAVIGLLLLGLFAAFIIFPAILAMREAAGAAGY